MARTRINLRDGMLLIAFFAVLVLIAARLDEAADDVLRGPFYAIDGDTLSIAGERLRLQGIDAPEIDQDCTDDRGKAWACGEAARTMLARLAGSPEAECLGRERDRYRRLLVRCHAGTTNINGALVRRGLAVASGRYSEEQVAARRERQGIWAGTFENPRDFRASRGAADGGNLIGSLMDWIKEKVAGE